MSAEGLPDVPPATSVELTAVGQGNRVGGMVMARTSPVGIHVRLTQPEERRTYPRLELSIHVDIDPFGRRNPSTIRCATR
ncbi:MAG TPA: hypothetical protein VNY84_10790, partial [Acidimicrobiales bacterium]|nr:hypothetical protein [Acidimicrobiales bacterium]